MPPNFAERTFTNSHKTTKFAKVLSLESFSLDGMCSEELERELTLVGSHRGREQGIIERFMKGGYTGLFLFLLLLPPRLRRRLWD